MLQPEQNHKDLSGTIQTDPPETSGHLQIVSAIDSLRTDMDARFGEVDERAHGLEQSMLAGFKAISEAFAAVHKRFDKQDGRIDGLSAAIEALQTEVDGIEHRLMERLESIEIKVDGVDNRLSGVEQDVNPG